MDEAITVIVRNQEDHAKALAEGYNPIIMLGNITGSTIDGKPPVFYPDDISTDGGDERE